MKIDKISRRVAVLGGLSALLFPDDGWPFGDDRQAEGGIGGTGIVGILVDTAPLRVSGTALSIDPETAVTNAYGSVSQQSLRRGNSLTVEARRLRDQLIARRVHVTYPLVGALSDISANGRQIRVNGIDVTLEGTLPRVRPGDRVAVSGLWRGPSVVASRVDRTNTPLDLVAGDVSRNRGTAAVGGVTLRGASTGRLRRGTFAEAIGVFDPNENLLDLRSLTSDRFKGAAGPLTQLAVEGYLEVDSRAPGFRISGLGHSFSLNLDLSQVGQTRALFQGTYTGSFNAQSALALPEGQRARYQLLRSLR